MEHSDKSTLVSLEAAQECNSVVSFNTAYPKHVPGPSVHLLTEYHQPDAETFSNLKWTLARHAIDACSAAHFDDLTQDVLPSEDVAISAIIKIQSIFRMTLTSMRIRRMVKNRKKWNALPVLLRFFKKGMKVNTEFAKLRAVRKVQAFYRGHFQRAQFCKRIYGALVLARAWRQYKMRLLCQRSIRRLDRPIVLTIDEVCNFPVQHVHSGKLSIQVSLYAFSLLHIVTGSDIAASIQTKKPTMMWKLHPTKIRPRVNGQLVDLELLHSDEEDDSSSSSNRSSSSDDETSKSKIPNLASAAAGSFSSLNKSVRSLLGGDKSETDKQGRRKPSLSPTGSFKEVGDCEFHYEVVIPGCHGNSILRFDILDDSRKLANFTYMLRRGSGLLFWGGAAESPLPMKMLQRSSVRAAQRRRVVADTVGRRRGNSVSALKDKARPSLRGVEAAYAALNPENKSGTVLGDGPILKYSVISGYRSDLCNFYISGNGPACRRYWAKKGIFAFMMFTWHSTYVSLTREKLYFFYKRLSIDPFLSIPLVNMVSINIVPGARQFQGDINPRVVNKSAYADTHNIEIRTKFGDSVHLRMVDLKLRNMWLFYLYKAHAHAVSVDEAARSRRPVRSAMLQRFSQIFLPDFITKRANISPIDTQEDKDNSTLSPASPIAAAGSPTAATAAAAGFPTAATAAGSSSIPPLSPAGSGLASGSGSGSSPGSPGEAYVVFEAFVSRGDSKPEYGMGAKLELLSKDALTPLRSSQTSVEQCICIGQLLREPVTNEYLPLERTSRVLPGDVLLKINGTPLRTDDLAVAQAQLDDVFVNSVAAAPASVRLLLQRRVKRGAVVPGQRNSYSLSLNNDFVQAFDDDNDNDGVSSSDEEDRVVKKSPMDIRKEVNAIAYASVKLKKIHPTASRGSGGNTSQRQSR